ncbi:efflux RND transporter periplasmic adaptor subunit [Sphingomonas albertensis]|uniref:Efflux RND transporter periplasmic adaptor subunit n=1 Tax=Sphingomonas albertensis TaxID=2762591 RepID=A0ABR7AL16_9SPHN|nr:efflux RND transporter periplasmic adaptor subunit [Sphingomonas albertensis]MBC3941106.1 efflux RND transporter periplasmic adaptor subunit [Sphingomonas albertensis]
MTNLPFKLGGSPVRRLVIYSAAGAALLIATGVAVVTITGEPSAPTTAAKPAAALTVTEATARRELWPMTVEASGAIAPWQEASIGTQIGGYQLIDVRVNVGDRVRRGQLLARLDPALLNAEEAQLRAGYDQAEANRQRALSLQASGAVSDQDVLQFVTEARTAAAGLAAKRLQLRYTSVVAPDDGIISARTATLGAVAPAGQEFFRLIRQERLEWRGELTAPQLARVIPGQKIMLELPDGTHSAATVRQTAPILDERSRLGIAYADIVGGSRARAGMYANGRIEMAETPAITVPAQSVVIRDGRYYVLKLGRPEAAPRASLQAVTIGRRRGDAVEILSGLAVGARVVVQGAGFLNDGDVVRLPPTAPAKLTKRAAQGARS